jgi:selenide, water dikinase
MIPQGRPARKRLLLLGAGHAHLEVLRRFSMNPPERTELVLVSPASETLYPGMLPGFVARQYSWEEVVLDAAAAAQRAGAVFVRDEGLRVSLPDRQLKLRDRPPLSFDLISLNIGSGTSLPPLGEGVREAPGFLATRPFLAFERRLPLWDSLPGELLVLGAGHAGFELACAFRARYPRREVTLLNGAEPLASPVTAALKQRNIRLLNPGKVLRIDRAGEGFLLRCEREEVRCTLLVAATGAAPSPLVRDSRLPENNGFLQVQSSLQALGEIPLFGAGDCIELADHPWVPKSGVYAVREAPVLAHNLRAFLAGRALRRYRPQRLSLRLLNLGDGSAIASRGSLLAQGGWAWRWKNHIDRKFMERHRPEASPMTEPACGGCGSKVSATTLKRMLGQQQRGRFQWGIPEQEDVALWKGSGRPLALTVDQFRNFGADPWLFGRIAAASAASDLHAKGVAPAGALMQLTVPRMAPALAEDWMEQLFSSVNAFLAEEGAELGGGQTNEGEEWNLGFTFWGETDNPWPKRGGRPGDFLVLTKPLGTGILLAASMAGAPVGRHLDHCLEWMARSNRAAARILQQSPPAACTDITGFSLLGHLSEMLSGLDAELELESIPLLPGSRHWFEKGFSSRMHGLNETSFPLRIPERARILYDPQTSGGLLFALDSGAARKAVASLRSAGEGAWIIGRLQSPTGSAEQVRIV